MAVKPEYDIEDVELPLSEDYYDTIALKTAVWQFLVDHFSTGVGQFKVNLFVRNEDDFWRRVTARKYKKYTTKDAASEYQKSRKREDHYRSLKLLHERTQAQDILYGKLRNGTVLNKIRFATVYILRRAANKLLPKSHP